MESWQAELEVEMMQEPTFINEVCPQNKQLQGETTEISFHEEIAATLGEDFPYPISSESNSSSPEPWDFDYSAVDPFSPSGFFVNGIHNNNNNNMENYFDSNKGTIPCEAKSARGNNSSKLDALPVGVESDEPEHGEIKRDKEDSKQQPTRSAKRRREPSQVYDHIMAERKRRELLTQRFIALSAIVPGLKKTDKTSVLGEAIKYLKQLQEKVNTLEEVAAKRTVESVVVVESQLVVNDDDNNDISSSVTMDDNCATASGNRGSGGDKRSLPEIEVRVSDKTLLIRIYCNKRNGIISKLFEEMEKHGLSISNSSIMSFGSLALDITIAAQNEKGLNKDVMKDIVRSIRTVLMTASQGPN